MAPSLPRRGDDPDARFVVRSTTRLLREEDVRCVGGELPRLLERSGGLILWLDLATVEWPTAGGLGGLVALHRWLRADGGGLVLWNVREEAYEVFRTARLTDVLDVRREGPPGEA
jgi:hypothetical protein